MNKVSKYKQICLIWIETYSSISARKWENQNRALLEICTKALLEDQKNL